MHYLIHYPSEIMRFDFLSPPKKHIYLIIYLRHYMWKAATSSYFLLEKHVAVQFNSQVIPVEDRPTLVNYEDLFIRNIMHLS